MKIKEGDWIRTQYNKIEKVDYLQEFFWGDYFKVVYNDIEDYAVGVSYDPRLLLKTGDLVMLHGFIIEVYVDEEAQDLSSYLDRKYILRNDITKIWTKDVCNNYILQWEV